MQLFSWRDAIIAAPIVAQFLADELGWSQIQMGEAVEQYTSKINRLLSVAGLAEKDSEINVRAH